MVMYTIWVIQNGLDIQLHPTKSAYESIEEAFVVVDTWNDTHASFAYVKDKEGNKWTRENGNGKLIIW